MVVTSLVAALVACGGVSTQGVAPTTLSAPPIANLTQEAQLPSAATGGEADVMGVSVSGNPAPTASQ